MAEYSLVSVYDPSAVRIEVPLSLINLLKQITEPYTIYAVTETTNSDGIALAEVEIDTSDDLLQLQQNLQKNKLPFWFELVGRSDQCAQLYGNYFNGEYRCKAIEPDDELVAATDVLTWYKQGCLEEKCQKVIDRCEPWVFTQEDVAVANQIMLRQIVKPGDANG